MFVNLFHELYFRVSGHVGYIIFIFQVTWLNSKHTPVAGHVGISNYLDNDILSKYNLLTPGSYLRPSPPSLQSPTVPELPNFMKNTEVTIKLVISYHI